MNLLVRIINKLAPAVLCIVLLLPSCKQKNKMDFDKMIAKYSKSEKDSLKLECLRFLKDNISDVTSERPLFLNQENDYVQIYLDTIRSERSLKKILQDQKIRYSSAFVNDADFISEELIEETIDKAINDWKTYPWNKNVTKDIFLNYLLPYKVLKEYPDNWRDLLFEHYKDTILTFKERRESNSDKLYSSLRKNAWSFLEYSNDFIKLTNSPSYNEILAIKKGQCYELSHFFVYLTRAAGIPSTIDIIPLWGKVSGSHAAEVFFRPIIGNGGIKGFGLQPWDPFISPPKVFRISFRKNRFFSERVRHIIDSRSVFIPEFLKSEHLLDVTNDYVPTVDLTYNFKDSLQTDIAYISVFNYGEWKPLFLGEISHNGMQAKFQNMATDMAYRIAIPNGANYKSIEEPFILDSCGNIIKSTPNFGRKQDVSVHKTNSGKDSWIRKGKTYVFKYLDSHGQWKEFTKKTSVKDSILYFKNVPSQAFYMIEEIESTKDLARIFLYKNKCQIWY